MSGIAPVADPLSALSAPSAGVGSSLEIWQLRANCGMIIGGVDAFISHITNGFSPLQEWVLKPLGGDWDALDKGSSAWSNAGNAVKAVADNIGSVHGQIGHSWTGETAERHEKATATIAHALAPLPGACRAMSMVCTALGEIAESIAEFVAEVLKELAHKAEEMLASLAVPVLGEIADGAEAADLLFKIKNWSTTLDGMIRKFIDLVKVIQEHADDIVDVIDAVDELLARLSKVTKKAVAVDKKLTAVGV